MVKKKIYKVISPTGDIYIVAKMFKFCKDYDLNASCMFNCAVARNGRTKHKGWSIELYNGIVEQEGNYKLNDNATELYGKEFGWHGKFLNWLNRIWK